VLIQDIHPKAMDRASKETKRILEGARMRGRRRWRGLIKGEKGEEEGVFTPPRQPGGGEGVCKKEKSDFNLVSSKVEELEVLCPLFILATSIYNLKISKKKQKCMGIVVVEDGENLVTNKNLNF
jgi:hypothetical protein